MCVCVDADPLASRPDWMVEATSPPPKKTKRRGGRKAKNCERVSSGAQTVSLGGGDGG